MTKVRAGRTSPAICPRSTRWKRQNSRDRELTRGADTMQVLIPGALRSYTRESRVEADGNTLAALFADLERRYPGLRFRVIDEQDRLRPRSEETRLNSSHQLIS